MEDRRWFKLLVVAALVLPGCAATTGRSDPAAAVCDAAARFESATAELLDSVAVGDEPWSGYYPSLAGHVERSLAALRDVTADSEAAQTVVQAHMVFERYWAHIQSSPTRSMERDITERDSAMPSEVRISLRDTAGHVLESCGDLASLELRGVGDCDEISAGADLIGCDLSSMRLVDVDLSGAFLQFANLDHSDLDGADLSEAFLLETSFTGTRLIDSRLIGADLRRTDLGSALLDGADLTDAFLLSAVLPDSVAGLNLSGAEFGVRSFDGMDLRHAILAGAEMKWSSMRSAQLDDADLSGVFLTDVDMTGATLQRARLNQATAPYLILDEADLTDADLSNANLYGASMAGANLSGAILDGANLLSADLHGADLADVRWGQAICPDGILSDRTGDQTCRDHLHVST